VNTINALYCQLFILIKTAFVPLIQEYLKTRQARRARLCHNPHLSLRVHDSERGNLYDVD
jgi:hypothetical protein